MGGAVGTAVSAAATAVTVATGGLGASALMAVAGGGAASVLGSATTAAIDHTQVNIDPVEVSVSAGLGLFGGSVTGTSVEDAGFREIGGPATRIGTLVRGLLNPSEHRRAAYHVCSRAIGAGYDTAAGVAATYVSRRLGPR